MTSTTDTSARTRRAERNAVRLAARVLLAACLLGPALWRSAAAQEPTPVPEPAAAPPASTPDDASAPVPAVGDTARPVANPRSVAVRKVRLVGESHNVVRTGPGNTFAIAGVFAKDAAFPVIAKSGDWYNIRLSATESGWVHASLCKEFDDLSDLEFKPNPKLYSRTGTFVFDSYGGAYAFDRKSNSLVLGGRLCYYVFDRVQFDGGVSWTHVKRPAEIVESLFGLSLEAEDFHMLFYNLNLTYEILPGRQMVPYVTGGVGSSIMQGRTEPSWNIGGGTSLFVSKRTAVRWEVRDYRFKTGSPGARVSNNNVEFTLGTAFLF